MPVSAFESDCVSVQFDAEINTIHLSWKRFAKGAEFKEALEQGLTAAKKFKATGWIGDVQYLGVVDEADTQWVNGDWFPRLLSQSALTHMAVIVGARHHEDERRGDHVEGRRQAREQVRRDRR
ncbi:MAG: hypothetical protein GQE15_42495 [Archangiaceae bacterium]|nr:hypothetical protein [Archangiaceae bacterium]